MITTFELRSACRPHRSRIGAINVVTRRRDRVTLGGFAMARAFAAD
jgi:hypothetical protein